MVKVLAITLNGKIEYLKVQGHAESGPYGHDLVCAGVSSITIGGINALNNAESFDIVQSDGLLVIKAKAKITKHDAVVLDTILVQLETIEASYQNHITIERLKK